MTKAVYILKYAESENGDVIGVGMEEIASDHPEYDWWRDRQKLITEKKGAERQTKVVSARIKK